LNASRALTQFSAGQYSANNVVNRPKIAWDYGSTRNAGEFQKYRMGEIGEGIHISVTLTWDRVVNFGFDADSDNAYDTGDTFINGGFTNLDLYLLPQGATDVSQAIWSSTSTTSTVEHMFFEIENTANYEFWVYQQGAIVIPDDAPDPFGHRQFYGLAWWTQTSLNVEGDFNGDGKVDDADLQSWKDGFGPTYDGEDFLAWQRNYGFGVPATPASVPEPSALILGVLGLPLLRRR
jgi:hypothetical protein